MTWLETSSVVPTGRELVEEVPQIAPEHGVEADGGLVEHEQIRAVQDRRAERDTRSLPAGQAGHDLITLRAELDEVDDLLDPARVDSEDRARSSEGSRAP